MLHLEYKTNVTRFFHEQYWHQDRRANHQLLKRKEETRRTQHQTRDRRRKKMETCGQGNAKGVEVYQGMHGCSSVIGVPFLRMRVNVLVRGGDCDDVFRLDGCLLCTLGVK